MEVHEEKPKAADRRVCTRNVDIAFGDLSDKYPPVLSLTEAAEIARIKPSTLKRKISEGHFKFCVSRGKPLRFFRNKFVVALFAE